MSEAAARPPDLAQGIEDRGREGNVGDAPARAADLEQAVARLATRLREIVAEACP